MYKSFPFWYNFHLATTLTVTQPAMDTNHLLGSSRPTANNKRLSSTPAPVDRKVKKSRTKPCDDGPDRDILNNGVLEDRIIYNELPLPFYETTSSSSQDLYYGFGGQFDISTSGEIANASLDYSRPPSVQLDTSVGNNPTYDAPTLCETSEEALPSGGLSGLVDLRGSHSQGHATTPDVYSGIDVRRCEQSVFSGSQPSEPLSHVSVVSPLCRTHECVHQL